MAEIELTFTLWMSKVTHYSRAPRLIDAQSMAYHTTASLSFRFFHGSSPSPRILHL